jgi:hypothetical protein
MEELMAVSLDEIDAYAVEFETFHVPGVRQGGGHLGGAALAVRAPDVPATAGLHNL